MGGYWHDVARTTLAGWLVMCENESTDTFCKFPPLSWRTNYGVFEELSFHENDDDYYFENPADKPGKTIFTPDITVFHKGTPRYLIEVITTKYQSVKPKKINRIYNFFNGGGDPIILEVSASHVLELRDDILDSEINRPIGLDQYRFIPRGSHGSS